MTLEKILSMTKKERLSIFKNNPKQTIYTGVRGESELQRKRVVVFGNVAIYDFGWVFELTDETGQHKQKFAINTYPKWTLVTR